MNRAQRAWVVAALISLAAVASAQVPLDRAIGRKVLRIGVVNASAVPEWEIRDLLVLRVGEAYDPAVVQRGLSLLAQKQGVRTVLVEAAEDGEGLALTFRIESEPLIRSVEFEGNHAFSDKALAAKIRTSVDQPVYPPFLDGDVAAIRDAYLEEGYPEARVEPVVKPRSDLHWVDVEYRVAEGPPANIGRVEAGDLGAMEPERARAILGLREGRRASLRKLKEGVRELVAVYHREGYPEARAPKPRFEKEPGGVTLVLGMIAGAAVDLRIEGVDELAARPLLEKAREYYGEPINADWADRVASAIGDVLRAGGYRNAIIAPEISQTEGARRVTFRVDRGPLVRVERVVFEGNDAESDARLLRYMSLVQGGIVRAPPFSQEALDRDVRALTDYYVSRGFLDARVEVRDLSVPPSGEAVLTLSVEEGIRYQFGRLEFLCSGGLTPAEALETSELKEGQPANPAAFEAARVKLLAEIARRGYADASAEFTAQRRPEANALDAVFRIRATDLVRFGKIVVSGNARTATRVILRELTLHEGQPWNAHEVVVSRRKLSRLGFFRKVRVEPVDPDSTSEVRDVRVFVEEQDAGSVSFGLGYGTEEGVNVSGELAHANLAGSGRALRGRGAISGQDWTASATYQEPWVFGYRLDLALSLLRQYQARPGYNVLSTGFQASLDQKITERFKASLLYTLEQNSLSDVAESAEVEDINQYLLSAVGPVLAWDSRDDPFNPKEGFQHTLQAEWAIEALGSEVRYSRYLGTSAGYFSWRKLTLALLARGGVAWTFGGGVAELPANKRFYLGGRTTVRGFGRDEIGPQDAEGNPLGGDTMVNFRAELRIPVWRSLGADIFWDVGNVWNRQIDRVDVTELRQGAGGGLRYITPIGPISFDIGFKLDQKEGEPLTEWYLTVGNVF